MNRDALLATVVVHCSNSIREACSLTVVAMPSNSSDGNGCKSESTRVALCQALHH
jgi:hypothetical protein